MSKSCALSLTVPACLNACIESRVEETGLSKSDVVRMALLSYFGLARLPYDKLTTTVHSKEA